MRKISLLLIGSFCVTNYVWSDGSVTNSGVSSPTNAPPVAVKTLQPEAAKLVAPASAMTAKPSSIAPEPVLKAESPQRAAREEIARRQEAQITARQLIDQGMKLYSGGKYADAIVKFEDALKILPRARATEADNIRVIRGLTDSYYSLANDAAKNKEYDKAKQLAKKALEYDPQNHKAEFLIVRIKAEESGIGPSMTSRPKEILPDETPVFLEKRNQIKKLFREGKILLGSGQFDEAEKRFQQILLLDPYNDDAHTLLEKVNAARLGFFEQAADNNRTALLMDVSRGWVPPISSQVEPPRPGTATPVAGESEALARIKEKLNKTILPEVSFRDATMTDVIRFLVDESRRLDLPTKEGVNIVLQTDQMGGSNVARQVSLNLHNIPLIEALRYATTGAGLEFRIEPNAVLVGTGLAQAPNQMITRTYPVSGQAFRTTVIANPATAGGAAGGSTTATRATGEGSITVLGGSGGTSTLDDVRKFFEDSGVPFPAGASLKYNERSSTIIIRNTTENLEIFERVLASINVVPMQVEIEAKFVEISQTDLDELAFQWSVARKGSGSFDIAGGSPSELFPPGSGVNPNYNPDITQGLRDSSSLSGNAIESLLAANGFGTAASSSADSIATIRGILTNPQFQVVIKALSQKQSADVLSAPKVTTIGGSAAVVKVVQEFIYPTAYNQPQVSTSGGGTGGGSASAAITPATPSTFSTREIGVLLNVTPTVGADGYTINLTMIPEVSEFVGFINYGSPMGFSSGASVVTVANDIKQPLFETRTLTTSVVIWDGQTVVLGGLIREQLQKIDDKIPFLGDIPFLGRLFRSKVTNRVKRNLLIFVTANLIDPAGNKIHKPSSAGATPS
ncbi:MAG: hypothetical protein ABSC38_06010 [Verrucomicrobiia bacterium]